MRNICFVISWDKFVRDQGADTLQCRTAPTHLRPPGLGSHDGPVQASDVDQYLVVAILRHLVTAEGTKSDSALKS
jgi:hypothetical protein